MRFACLLAFTLAACPNDISNLPGQFLGSFLFSADLIFGDGGTTCVIDGGALTLPPAPVQFYAQLSLLDAGAIDWQLLNALPVQGTLVDGVFSETTATEALVSGCNCAASLAETVTLYADGGFVAGLSQLAGLVDDRLDPEDDFDAGSCFSDAGLGCGLGCDLIYSVTGVPAEPGGGY